MFLSQRRGMYYLWYVDSDGRKKKVSTRARLKADALQFLISFKREAIPPWKKRLKNFTEEFLPFAEATFSNSWANRYRLSLDRLLSMVGGCFLSSLTVHHIERYRVRRLADVTPISMNHKLQALRAAIYTAVRGIYRIRSAVIA